MAWRAASRCCLRSFPRRSLALSRLSGRGAAIMASGGPPVIVLSSSSSSDGESEKQRAAAAKRARRESPTKKLGDAQPRPPTPSFAAAAAAADAAATRGDDKEQEDKTKSTTLSFDRCDPLFTCGFALTAAPALEREQGFENCNATVDRGARLSDLVTGSPRNALVSNFMIDPVWLFTSFPALRNVRGHLAIAMGDDRMVEATRQSLLVFACKECLSATVTRPPTQAFGTHHSKFFVLEYSWGVLVVVVTGNFIPNEYESKAQAVWFQKFPVKDLESPETSDFEGRLLDYVSQLKLSSAAAAAALLRAVRRCDFSSARADLVTAVPGNHKGGDYARYATGRLGSLLSRTRGFSESLVGSQLVAQCSSLGRLSEGWLSAWTEAASDGTTRGGARLGAPTSGGRAGGGPFLPLSIVWPTAEEIRASVEGWSGGGSVPGRSEVLALPAISERLCRWDGGAGAGGGGGGGGGGPGMRSRAVPHLKTFLRADLGSAAVAWCLVGSANFSVAAWGSATKARDSSYVRSWELGVLLTPEREAAYRRHRHRGFNGGSVSEGAAGAATAAVAAAAAAAAADAVLFPPGSLLRAAGRAEGARTGPLPADAANLVEFYAAGRAPGQAAAASAAVTSSGTATATKVEIVQLPIPYLLPPRRYRPGTDQPWVTDVAFPGADSLGRYLSPN